MTSEELELVTAYLDGEATADERARVEADRDLLAEVERLRSVRTALHDVEPPSSAARERALAAAMAVFDDEIAPAIPAAAGAPGPERDVTAPMNIVPLDQRRRVRWMQGLGAAAAALVIVVGGAVIATRGGGDDDGTSADEQRADTTGQGAGDAELESTSDIASSGESVEPPAAPAPTMTTIGPGLLVADPATTLGDASEAADAVVADTEVSGTDGGASGPAGSAPAAEAPAPAPMTMPTQAAAAPTTAARLDLIASEDELAAFAEKLKEPPVDLGDAEDDCADRLLKADAMFEDDDGEQHPVVVVAVDADTVGLLTLDDCDVVLDTDETGG